LAVTVGLLLLIGSITVGMLLLVRTEARRSELAMCLALGGTRLGLARGIVIEGTLLAVAGVLVAVPVAYWAFRSLSTFALPGGLDMARIGLALDVRALAAVLVAGLAATLLMALVAGILGLTPNIASALRARSGGTSRQTGRRLRAAIVAGQVAVALVLLTGAGLFARSLATALSLPPGFDATRILMANVSLGQYGYSGDRADLFFAAVLDRVTGSPAIDAASLTRSEGGMGAGGQIVVDGIPRQFASMVWYRAVDDRYFATMGMQVVKGRPFQASDTTGSPLVVIVSESLGREIAEGGDPIGHRIRENSWKPGQEPDVAEVIGVVPDVITNVADTSSFVKYYSLRQRAPLPHATFVLRTNGNTSAAIQSATAAIRSVDPLVAPAPMMTVADQLRRQMSAQDLGVFVLGGLGTIATLLTLLGAYVVADSMSASRRREFTIRRALGASRVQLGATVLIDTARLVGIGILAGLVLAWLGAGTIRTFLFRVEPLDPTVLLSVSGGILLIALLVSLRPAMESARVDVTSLLRDE
jgi:putative ABC transport system permease protein